MMFNSTLEFIDEFINELDQAIQELKPSHALSKMQRRWLSFCLKGMLLTNTLCWKEFECASLGEYKQAALSWMFRHSKLPWKGADSLQCIKLNTPQTAQCVPKTVAIDLLIGAMRVTKAHISLPAFSSAFLSNTAFV